MEGQSLGSYRRSRSESKKIESLVDLDVDFDEKHDEYLISLQQRNRILKQLQTKDQMQIELERLEQGFSLYLNGANSELRKQPGNPSAIDPLRSGVQTARTSARELNKRQECCRSHTAPAKIQRKGWSQNSVKIKTETGTRVNIGPPSKYSEDFETYESLNMSMDDIDHDGSKKQRKSSRNYIESDLNVFDRNAKTTTKNIDVEKERLLLNFQDVKAIRESLELSVSHLRSCKQQNSSEESDSIEEDVHEEQTQEAKTALRFQNLNVDTTTLFENNASKCQETKKQKGLGHGNVIVLEIGPNSCAVRKKQERVLSAKRKDNAELYIPIKPVIAKSKSERPLSACSASREEHDLCSYSTVRKKQERVLSAKRKDNAELYIPIKPVIAKSKSERPLSACSASREEHDLCSFSRSVNRQERPLSATRRSVVETKDCDQSTSEVINAIHAENQALKAEPRSFSKAHGRQEVSHR